MIALKNIAKAWDGLTLKTVLYGENATKRRIFDFMV